jgi:ATP-dependent Clp protease adaptor protein ClpS
MAQEPTGPGGGGGDPGPVDPRREGEVATRTRRKVARPPRYKVVLYNDDFTPMEFVVAILENVFGKGPGLGVAGVFVLEVAETKVATVHRLAEQRGYPLRSGVEKE